MDNNNLQANSAHMKKRRDLGVKIRLKFRKYGAMRFIGHLDVMRYFQKLIRRSGIDIAYSEGFHPHQIMSFANPLGVGMLSEGEYVDITLNSAISSADIVKKLNAQNVEGFEIIQAVRLPEEVKNGMASVAIADYKIDFIDSSKIPADLEEIVTGFFSQDEILIEKKTKKGSKIINLKNSIHELQCNDNSIFMKVNAGSAENIRPEMVLNAIYDYAGRTLEDFSYHMTRLEQYDDNNTSLLLMGEVF